MHSSHRTREGADSPVRKIEIPQAVDECIVKRLGSPIVDADLRLGGLLKVSGTPTVFLDGVDIGVIGSGEQLGSLIKRFASNNN